MNPQLVTLAELLEHEARARLESNEALAGYLESLRLSVEALADFGRPTRYAATPIAVFDRPRVKYGIVDYGEDGKTTPTVRLDAEFATYHGAAGRARKLNDEWKSTA